MKINPVTFFEIPVVNLERAIQFYQAVFGFSFSRQHVDGNEFAWFPLAEGAFGAAGALAKGDSYVPATTGTRVYFHVADIAASLARVHAHGGATLYPRTDIGEYGVVAECSDSEGNRIALLQPPAPKQP